MMNLNIIFCLDYGSLMRGKTLDTTCDRLTPDSDWCSSDVGQLESGKPGRNPGGGAGKRSGRIDRIHDNRRYHTAGSIDDMKVKKI